MKSERKKHKDRSRMVTVLFEPMSSLEDAFIA